jgi:hypothetical protein
LFLHFVVGFGAEEVVDFVDLGFGEVLEFWGEGEGFGARDRRLGAKGRMGIMGGSGVRDGSGVHGVHRSRALIVLLLETQGGDGLKREPHVRLVVGMN